MSATIARARFASWTGGCVLIGRTGFIPEHAHYAIQVVVGTAPGIRVRSGDAWNEYAGAVIPSRRPHSIDASGLDACAVLFIEPETPEGRMLAMRYLHSGVAPLPAASVAATARAIFAAAAAGDGGARLTDECRKLLRALIGDTEQPAIADARVMRAIAYVNANLHDDLTLERVAGEAYLSPSRFRHLFVENTGMALRSYILWRRFLYVWELLNRGASLSQAAHTAGFADAAHLTRTSRKFFGFPPSALQLVPNGVPAIPAIVPAPSAGLLTRPAPRQTGLPLSLARAA